MHKLLKSSHSAMFVVSVCLMVALSSGCETFRKKFTRKKKKAEVNNEFIPILEPIDYPSKAQDPTQQYKYHYSLWKVWEKDLLQAFTEVNNDKRQKYLLGQMIEQLEKMASCLVLEKEGSLKILIGEYDVVAQILDRPLAMRDVGSLKLKVERINKKIRSVFNPQLLEASDYRE